MIKTVTIHCPQCDQTCDLFITIDASMLMVTCPECGTPIISYDQDHFSTPVSKKTFISGTCLNPSTSHIIKKITDKSNCIANHDKKMDKCSLRINPARHPNSEGTYSDQKTIEPDDLTNLRIDLAMCKDVSEFIDRL